MLERLWAGWRGDYVATATDATQDGPACVFCRILASGAPDDETFVLWRGERTFAILNAYPYGSGHLMVLPLRHVGELDELDEDEAAELFGGVRAANVAIKGAYAPGGVNVGMNLGRAAGAGVPGHLHVHLLPRWLGDTNFMTSIGETRVLPELLSTAYVKLKGRMAEPVNEATTSDDHVVDELPDDLNAAGYVGPYTFPDNSRRRIPGALYLLAAAVCIALRLTAGDDAVLVNDGLLWAGAGLGLFGLYCFAAGYPTRFDETDALVEATRTVGFPVGHASAQLGWRGLRSRPTWRILLYSAEEPPAQRGLVLVDAVDGKVLEHFVEANPEDWSELQ